MRRVISSPLITLDGFIAGPRGELDWDAVLARALGESMGGPFDLLIGNMPSTTDAVIPTDERAGEIRSGSSAVARSGPR